MSEADFVAAYNARVGAGMMAATEESRRIDGDADDFDSSGI
jgi:hypothetical protein